MSAPMIGWKWLRWTSAKVRCQRCNRRVRYGLVSISNDDPTSPAFRTLCEGCARFTMQEEAPAEWGTPEWKGDR